MMKQLTKAQILISVLACFSIAICLFQQISTQDMIFNIGLIILQFAAIIILSFVLLTILEWFNVFDLKTNAILTLITVVMIRLPFII